METKGPKSSLWDSTRCSVDHESVNEKSLEKDKEVLIEYMKTDILLLGGVMQKAQNIYWKLYQLDIESKITLLSLALNIFRLRYEWTSKRGRDTKIPQSGGPPIKVGDEVVHKELGDRMERAATTASSFEAEQDSESGKPTQVFDVPKIYPNLFKQAKETPSTPHTNISYSYPYTKSAPETSPSRITSSPSLSPQHTPVSTLSTLQPPNTQPTPNAEEAVLMPYESPLHSVHSLGRDEGNRQDVMDLYRLVEERYATSRPEGYDLILWGDLKILFQPDEEDEVWRHQHEYNLISWRLFDSCGIHNLLMDNGIAIHMMIEKKYPLTQEMLSKMLSRKLEVDHENEMVFELLRFIRSQVQK
ncbi:putative reverse transcriptase domain-containing protein [Tanacetum coccineum]